jgi:hypothetical protein
MPAVSFTPTLSLNWLNSLRSKEKKGNAYGLWLVNQKDRDRLSVLGVNVRIILKLTLKKQAARTWLVSPSFGQGPVAGYCENDHETFGSV